MYEENALTQVPEFVPTGTNFLAIAANPLLYLL